jgi:hypothetical protein
MYLLFAILLMFISAFTMSGTHAEERDHHEKHRADKQIIKIAAASLSNLVEKDQTGIYQILFKHAMKTLPYRADEIYLPFRRALLEFEHKQVDCTYSSTEVLEAMLGKDAIISSYPLGSFYFHVFTLKDAPLINNLNQLETMHIGGINGQAHYYISLLPPTTQNNLKLLNSDSQGLEMLKLKRLDAYIGALPDLFPYLDTLSYDKEFILYQSFDRITCHNTAKNRAFLDLLSTQLEYMKNTGEYRRIAGDLYIDF